MFLFIAEEASDIVEFDVPTATTTTPSESGSSRRRRLTRGESVESWGQTKLTFSGQPSYRAEPLLKWMDKVMSDLTDTMEHSPTRFYFLFNLYSYLPRPPSILGDPSISPPQIHVPTRLRIVSLLLFLSLSCTHQSESQGPRLRARHEGTFKRCINSQAVTVIRSLSLAHILFRNISA